MLTEKLIRSESNLSKEYENKFKSAFWVKLSFSPNSQILPTRETRNETGNEFETQAWYFEFCFK